MRDGFGERRSTFLGLLEEGNRHVARFLFFGALTNRTHDPFQVHIGSISAFAEQNGYFKRCCNHYLERHTSSWDRSRNSAIVRYSIAATRSLHLALREGGSTR
jgi:hypothetical protein